MRLKEARASGAMFYTGKVCERHTELKGKRRAKSGNCHLCIVERMRRTRAKKKASEGVT
jgi:hypothetical protein